MKSLDLDKIKDRITGNIDMQTALKDVTPIDWPDEVLEGKKQVTVTGAKMEGETCVRLEISLS